MIIIIDDEGIKIVMRKIDEKNKYYYRIYAIYEVRLMRTMMMIMSL
jgi:hypothetical protein